MNYTPTPCICGGAMKDLLSFTKTTMVFVCETEDYVRVKRIHQPPVWYQLKAMIEEASE